jgi:glycosyltransferase involved in cell wall biosynthesis
MQGIGRTKQGGAWGGGKIGSVPKYSIVVPFHNEEENVTRLYDRVKDVMEHVGSSFELVFVDDGSRDRTYRLLEEIAAVDSRVLVVKLRRMSLRRFRCSWPNSKRATTS